MVNPHQQKIVTGCRDARATPDGDANATSDDDRNFYGRSFPPPGGGEGEGVVSEDLEFPVFFRKFRNCGSFVAIL